jgi:hypothetical protein
VALPGHGRSRPPPGRKAGRRRLGQVEQLGGPLATADRSTCTAFEPKSGSWCRTCAGCISGLRRPWAVQPTPAGQGPVNAAVGLRKGSPGSCRRKQEILRSHLIDPAALRADDFDRFFEARSREDIDSIGRCLDVWNSNLKATVVET